jgi:hypothetical protein
MCSVDRFRASAKLGVLGTVPKDNVQPTIMRWFRNHIRRGSWLALVALVINLGLSFGHVHAIDGKRSESGLISLIAAASSDTDRTQGHPGDSQADYLCPICIAVSAMANAFTSAPPVLPVEFAGPSLDRPIESLPVFGEPPTAAFQSRAPPVS